MEAVSLSEDTWTPLTSCHIPDLPQPRWAHTQDGILVCGGYGFGQVGEDVMSSCLSLGGQGGWRRSHQLLSRRHEHTSWRTEAGVMLLGGEASYTTSEVVSEESQEVRPSFDLNKPRRCEAKSSVIFN